MESITTELKTPITMTENDTDKLLARLKEMEDNIVNRLEVKLTDKIRDITDNALQMFTNQSILMLKL